MTSLLRFIFLTCVSFFAFGQPRIYSAAYKPLTNQLTVIGANFVSVNGDANDIDASMFSIVGQGGESYTLSDTPDVEITTAREFTLHLGIIDRTYVEGLLTKWGTSAADGTTYELSAAVGFNDTSSPADTNNKLTVGDMFVEQTITNIAAGASAVSAADMDGDGDLDVLSASINDNTVAWYQNDGNENFSNQKIISNSASGANSAITADVDGDGDMDVLSSLSDDNKIVWYQNDGNQNFTEYVISTTAKGASSIAVGDVNDDGHLDVLSASFDDNKIAWYKNDGDQNFTEYAINTTAKGASSVTVADVDGDGDLDVLSASTSDNKIIWYQNNGSGHFTSHTISTKAFWTYSVATADIDGDGSLDVLSAVYYYNKIVWYQNDGTQNFIEKTISSTAFGATAVSAADVDNDGDMDVLSASSSDDKIAWYENDGAGNFITHEISTNAGGANSVITADIDGDGNLDVLSTSYTDDTVTLYKQNPFGSLVDSATYDAATGILTVTRTDAGSGLVRLSGSNNDIDASKLSLTGQGNASHTLTDTPDVDITDENGFSLTLSTTDRAAVNALLNKDGTSAKDATVYSLSLAAGFNSTASVLDMTNPVTVSNISDIFSATYDALSNELVVSGIGFVAVTGDTNDIDASKLSLTGQGGVSYTLADTPDVEITSATTFVLHLGPIDRTYVESLLNKRGAKAADGTSYMLSAAVGYNGASALIDSNNALMVITKFSTHIISTSADAASSVIGADVDGDGDMDVLSASRFDATIAWYENDGTENFTTHEISNNAIGAWSVITADVDGDGDLDVLSASPYDNTVAWYKNNGSEQFTTQTISTTADGVRSVATADVDNDGDIDVLSASFNSKRVDWYKNDGIGNFTAHNVSSTTDGGQSIATADINNDGYVDVVSASHYDNKIAWHENNGTGSFTQHEISTAAIGARSVAVADMDGDGKLDALSASFVDNKIAWYKNEGSGSFTSHEISTTAGGASSVAAADINGDGYMDALSAHFNDDVIAWYQHDGTGNFTIHEITNTADGARSVAAADVDGDGTMDVLSASYNDDTVTLYKQNPFGPLVDSATYDAATGILTVTRTDAGSGLVRLSGSNNDIDASKLSLTGQGNASHTLTDTPDVDITDENGFSLTLSTTDRAAVNALLNKDGTSAKDATVYSLSLAAGFNSTASVLDMTNPVTVSNISDIFSATYDALSNELVVSGIGFVAVTGDTNDIDASKLSLTGQGGVSYTLADTPDVEITSATTFVLHLGPIDRTYVEGLLNKRGGLAVDGTAFTLAAAAGFNGENSVANTNNKISVTCTFTAHNISTETDGVRLVTTADVDNDGDLDALSASIYDNTIAWHENKGAENFVMHKISTDAQGAFTVTTADVNGDGFLDVLSASYDDDKIAWYENDGQQNFTPHTITNLADEAYHVATADLDVDGDIDVLSASVGDDKIAWYRNDGNGGFSNPIIISNVADRATLVTTADVDGDGDLDVLSSSASDNKIAWYENDGNQNFTPYIISTNAATANGVTAVDMDGDGDIDVISSALYDGITWYEQDVNHNFTPHKINSEIDETSFVATADLDGDGDIDVFSSSVSYGIKWHENDGSENFIIRKISTEFDPGLSVAIADVDGDGAMDVLSASFYENAITWYKQNPFGPLVDSATYDAATGMLTVTRTDAGSGLIRLSGSNNDIDASKLVLTGHGNASHTLTDTPDADITDENGFSLTLSTTDRAAVNALLNKDGTSAKDATVYNLSLAAGFNGAGSVEDRTNPITVSNSFFVDQATYDAFTAELVVSGNGFVSVAGDANDIDASKLVLTGQGNASHTLTDTPDVDITDENGFSLTLSTTDRAAVSALLNKDGTSAKDATVYNLSLAAGFNGAESLEDMTNPVTVSGVQQIESQVLVYPIPTKDKLIISLGAEQVGIVRLFSILGNLLIFNEIEDYIGTLDIQNLPTGVYLLNIETEKTNHNVKVIKK